MTASRPLTWLLSDAARAAFFGRPTDGLEPLNQARIRLDSQDVEDPVALDRMHWLNGVILTASGRYAAARAALEPLLTGPVHDPHLTALGCAVAGSIERQLSRHAAGREYDTRGLQLAEPLGDRGLEARMDCAVGLSADAVGLGETDVARARLAEVSALLDAHGPAAGWRARCRTHWVRAEISLMTDRPDLAQEAAGRAVRIATAAGAPRHRAKSLLFLGVAQVGVPGIAPATAAGTLRDAVGLAESLGLRPLLWPACQVLARLLPDADESRKAREQAGNVLREIASELPGPERQVWLERPELAEITVG